MNLTRRPLIGLVGLTAALGSFSFLATSSVAKVYARKVPFQDSSAFDDALSKSMGEGFEAIDVELPQVYGKRMPPRARAWVARIARSGGEVRFRDVTPASRGIWIVLIEVIVGIVGPYAIEEVRKAMRDPANDYHVVIVGQGTDPASAELLGVEFYRRGSASWAEAYDKSKAMKLPT